MLLVKWAVITVKPKGRVEFLHLADAEKYRDLKHPGCEIVDASEEIEDEPVEETPPEEPAP